MITTSINDNASAATTAQLTNYRIYDRTGGGVRHDIYAESLDEAIEQGREWIEDGDWGQEAGENDECRLLKLECSVREIVRVPDLRSIDALPGVGDVTIEDDAVVISADSDSKEKIASALGARLSRVGEPDADMCATLYASPARCPR